MTNTTTTTPTWEQLSTELGFPWSLHFDRDGTEDYGVICDAEVKDLVASHLPGTSFGDRTFETGTFWLPEKNDPTPLRVRQMKLMAAAPKLLEACKAAHARLLAGYSSQFTMQEIERMCPEIAQLRTVIAEATDDSIGRAA